MSRKNTALKSKSKIYGKTGTGWTNQSLAYKDKSHRYALTSNPSGSRDYSNNIVWFDESKIKKTYTNVFSVGHANGGTYCHYNDYIYAIYGNTGAAYSTVYGFDTKDNFKRKYKVTLPVGVKGLGYDRVTGQFYGHNGTVGGKNSRVYVFPLKAFVSYNNKKYKGKYKSYSAINLESNYFFQDCAGYNGVIMSVRSVQVRPDIRPAYIDCYNAKNGKYLGTYTSYAEVESIAVEEKTGYIHILTSGSTGRWMIKTSNKFKFKGEAAKFDSDLDPGGTEKPGVKKLTTTQLRNKIVKKAKSYKGYKETHFCKTYGAIGGSYSYDWCAAFVWTVFKECDMDDIIKKTAYVPTLRDWLKEHGSSKTIKTAKGGDIAFYGGASHVEIVAGKNDKGQLLTIGGNTGPSKYSGADYHKDSSVSAARVRENPTSIYAPPYSKTKASGGVDEDDVEGETVNVGLDVHPDQLYSSQNYEYLPELTATVDQSREKQKADIQNMLTSAASFKSVPSDSAANIAIITGTAQNEAKRPKTKVDGEVHGPNLPIALNPVEAPFVELTIGGETFGVSSEDGYPNYINGLRIIRTNGSMNEYTINLVHQVSAGRNPNYIDELISKNGYNKIGIKYGDANSNVVFTDDSALLISSNTSFDFASCNIKYTVKATSSVMSIATHKTNRSAVTDTGSNIIKNLISTSSALSDAFPLMKDSNYVSTHNLIPNDDSVISIDAIDNINDLNYLKTVVASMKSAANPDASYYLILADDYFKVFELAAQNASYDAQLYEVNINYPDDNQIFSFNNETDFAWSLAYEHSENVTNYDYNVDRYGNVIGNKVSSANMLSGFSNMQMNTADNWWKQVTEFPTTAKLTCRGLLSPLLLMTYIKVNCYYYGSQRITGGVYIVVGQEDSLDANGYRTTLSLTKVAGPQQHLTIDSRIKT